MTAPADLAALRRVAEAAKDETPWPRREIEHLGTCDGCAATRKLVAAYEDPEGQSEPWLCAECDADTAYVQTFGRPTVLALIERCEKAEQERDAARGDSPDGFMSQREWEDWSIDLAQLVPEEYEDDVAQEAIIERALEDLVTRAKRAEATLERVRAVVDESANTACTRLNDLYELHGRLRAALEDVRG